MSPEFDTGTGLSMPGLEARAMRISINGEYIELIPDAIVKSLATRQLADRLYISQVDGLFDDPPRRQNRTQRPDGHGTIPSTTLLDERMISIQGWIRAGNFFKLRDMQRKLKGTGLDQTGEFEIIPFSVNDTSGRRGPANNQDDPRFTSAEIGTAQGKTWQITKVGSALTAENLNLTNASTVWAPRNGSMQNTRYTATHDATTSSTVVFIISKTPFFVPGNSKPIWAKLLMDVTDSWPSMIFRVSWFRDIGATLPSAIRTSDETASTPGTGFLLKRLDNLTPPSDAVTGKLTIRLESTVASDGLGVNLLGANVDFGNSPVEDTSFPAWRAQQNFSSYPLDGLYALYRRSGAVNWARSATPELRIMGDWVSTNSPGLLNAVQEVSYTTSLNTRNQKYQIEPVFRVASDQPNDSTTRVSGVTTTNSAPAVDANGGWTGRIPAHEGQTVRITARVRVVSSNSTAANAPRANVTWRNNANVVINQNDPSGNGADGLPALVRAGTAPGDYDIYYEMAAPAGTANFEARLLQVTAQANQHLEFLFSYVVISIDDSNHPRDAIDAYSKFSGENWQKMGTDPSVTYTDGQPERYYLKNVQVADFKSTEKQDKLDWRRDFLMTVRAADPRIYSSNQNIKSVNAPAGLPTYVSQTNPGTAAITSQDFMNPDPGITLATTHWNQTPYTALGYTQARNSTTGEPLANRVGGMVIPTASVSGAMRQAAVRVSTFTSPYTPWSPGIGMDGTAVVLKRINSTNFIYGILRSDGKMEIHKVDTGNDTILSTFSLLPYDLAEPIAAGNLWLTGYIGNAVGDEAAYLWLVDGHPAAVPYGGARNINGMSYPLTAGEITKFGTGVSGVRGWGILDTESLPYAEDQGKPPTVFQYEEGDITVFNGSAPSVNLSVFNDGDVGTPYEGRIDGPISGARINHSSSNRGYTQIIFPFTIAAGEYVTWTSTSDRNVYRLSGSNIVSLGNRQVQQGDLGVGSFWRDLDLGFNSFTINGAGMTTATKFTAKYNKAYM